MNIIGFTFGYFCAFIALYFRIIPPNKPYPSKGRRP